MTRPTDPIYAIDTSIHGASMIITKNSRLYCVQCKVFRPLRTGHCKRCNICVTRIDHHCAFLNNCVGSNNQRYFCQFIIYTAILLIMYITCSPFAKQNVIKNVFNGENFNFKIFIIFGFLPLFGTLAFLFLLFLIINQIQTITKNQTFTEVKFYNERKAEQINDKPTNDKSISFMTVIDYLHIC